MSRTAARLAELGIELPAPAAPAANYVPWVRTGNLVVVSGQIPMEGGEVRYRGVVGADLDLETGRAAARLCGLNLLAQVREACGGDLDRVVRCVRLGGFVQSADGFTQQPAVINGASDLLHKIFEGDDGHHARSAIGFAQLPTGVAVEIEAIFEIK